MPSDRELTAFHEAAHAYAAVQMGLGACIRDVSVRPACMRYYKRRQRPAKFDFSRPEWANLELVVCMAGETGEAMRQYGADRADVGNWDGCNHDCHAVTHYAQLVAGALGKDLDDVLQEAARFTHQMLRDGWPAVEAIADVLLERDLTGFEVEDICRRLRHD